MVSTGVKVLILFLILAALVGLAFGIYKWYEHDRTTPPSQTPPCTTNADCVFPFNCVSGVCTAPPACNTSSNCPSNQGCYGGYCIQQGGLGSPCTIDGMCQTPLQCINNVCTNPTPSQTPCTSNTDCTPLICYNGSCAPPIGPGGSCSTTSQCQTPYQCITGTCGTSIPPSGPGTDLLTTASGGTASLSQGSQLINSNYTITMNADGTVTYNDPDGYNVWTSPAMQSGSPPYSLTMMNNGRLCVTDSTSNLGWCSPSASGTAPYEADLSATNFCVNDSTNKSLWCASNLSSGPNTTSLVTNGISTLNKNQRLISSDGNYSVVMQNDGNVVIYNGDPSNPNNATWASNTDSNDNTAVGNPPYFFSLGSDGNLCMYSGTIASSNAYWCSDTSGAGAGAPYTATMNTDGSLQIYDGSGSSVWNSVNDTPAPGQNWSPPTNPPSSNPPSSNPPSSNPPSSNPPSSNPPSSTSSIIQSIKNSIRNRSR
jgi:hypothetical protein